MSLAFPTRGSLFPVSKQVITVIQDNEQESRKEWMLSIYQFWRQRNQPKECYSPQFSVQELNYIHNNPVEAGIVEKPEEYLYSSARSYQQKTGGLLEVQFL